jgi:hypothetical protein
MHNKRYFKLYSEKHGLSVSSVPLFQSEAPTMEWCHLHNCDYDPLDITYSPQLTASFWFFEHNDNSYVLVQVQINRGRVFSCVAQEFEDALAYVNRFYAPIVQAQGAWGR